MSKHNAPNNPGDSGLGSDLSRREFLGIAGGLFALPVVQEFESLGGPAIKRSTPLMEFGVASGDVGPNSAVVWSRADRPARMFVEWSTTSKFADATTVMGPTALPEADFTAKMVLTGLPSGQTIFYRVRFQDLSDARSLSEPVQGSFRTPSRDRASVRVAWSADTVGQGWGIDLARGGIATYQAIADKQPDVFFHLGDSFYADAPLQPTIALPDGSKWSNLVTPEKAHVAETQADFWGNARYPLLDPSVRRMNASVPLVMTWDDHETRNDWYPGQNTEDPRYTGKSIDMLAARARKAFLDYSPMGPDAEGRDRIYRRIAYSPMVDFFVLDMRSYRGANGTNDQPDEGPQTKYLGAEQLNWLKAELLKSTAVWKVMLCSMPIGLQLNHAGPFEGWCNKDDGAPLGRELELASLLRFMKSMGMHDVIWLTADVHYSAAMHFSPERAKGVDFLPFWQFISGPLHAGTYPPPALDHTFGPKVEFQAVPSDLAPNQSPAQGLQFFGMLEIDPRDNSATVSIHNRVGESLYSVRIPTHRQ